MERAKQLYLSHYRALPKSLERATGDRLLGAMLGPDRRFRDPAPEEIAALTLEGMQQAVMAQLHAGNLEVRCLWGLGFGPPAAAVCCAGLATPALRCACGCACACLLDTAIFVAALLPR